ncbi:MAG TPA: hypothetical protein VFI78_05190 [Salinimicrobium sp.]|nr:hypothetical protein [Salinimicrobium sp.]
MKNQTKRPQKCISVEKARKLQDDWKESRGKEIERGQGYEDTREFWYSLDELQEYLDYVREKSEEQGVKKPGIRIYFAAYPKSNDKKSYSTVFLAPTKEKTSTQPFSMEAASKAEDDNENNYDIDPINYSDGGIPPRNY